VKRSAAKGPGKHWRTGAEAAVRMKLWLTKTIVLILNLMDSFIDANNLSSQLAILTAFHLCLKTRTHDV